MLGNLDPTEFLTWASNALDGLPKWVHVIIYILAIIVASKLFGEMLSELKIIHRATALFEKLPTEDQERVVKFAEALAKRNNKK